MENWSQFLFMTGGLLLIGVTIMIRGYFDDRQWQRQKEAEEAASRAPAE